MKHIILSIMIVVSLFISGCTQLSEGDDGNMDIQSSEVEESGEINFQLIGSYAEFDTSNMHNRFNGLRGLTADTEVDPVDPFTFFYQFHGLTHMQSEIAKEFGFESSDYEFTPENYQDKYFVITVGKKLLEMRYKYDEVIISQRTFITFAEEHNSDVLYFYATDPIPIFSSELAGPYNAFYVMNGTDRVYYGDNLLTLNGVQPIQ